MKLKTCKTCRIEFEVNSTNFRLVSRRDEIKKYYETYSSRCLINGCYNAQQRRYKREYYRANIHKSREKHGFEQIIIRKAEIGSKTEPYFEGENFGYIPPSYEEIKQEYRL